MEGQMTLWPMLERYAEHHYKIPGDKDWRGYLFYNEFLDIEFLCADSREELIKIMDEKEENYFKEKE